MLFWAIGSFSLFATSMGIIDYTSRLAADVIKTTYLRGTSTSESRIYFRLVWGMVALGVAIILSGFNQPLVLLVISACTGGAIMFLLFVPADRAEPGRAAAGDRSRPPSGSARWSGRRCSSACSPR